MTPQSFKQISQRWYSPFIFASHVDLLSFIFLVKACIFSEAVFETKAPIALSNSAINNKKRLFLVETTYVFELINQSICLSIGFLHIDILLSNSCV